MNERIVFIGAGNMAEALVRGLVGPGGRSPGTLVVTDPRAERCDFFLERFGVRGLADNAEAVRGADVVVLAVKPQVMGDVLGGLAATLPAQARLVSIAAGIRCATIESAFSHQPAVVRVMPNTPALVGQGVSALCPGRWARDADLAQAEALLRPVGAVVRVEESQMDAVTAVSGSGPAYVFYLMEAMLAAAGDLGLAPAVARQLVYQTVAGAAALAADSTEPPDVLRARVTSKGGTTAAAIATLDERGVRDALVAAVRAAHRRAGELSRT